MKRRIFNRRPKSSSCTHDNEIHTTTTSITNSSIGTSSPSKQPTSSSSSSSSLLPIFNEHVKTHQTIYYRRKQRQTRIIMMKLSIFILLACFVMYIIIRRVFISSLHQEEEVSSGSSSSIILSSSSNTTTTKWPHDTIHILNTRFMQHQPHLKTLAQARLLLFQTTCLPSIIHQNFRDFIWIIKIDPHLDIEIREKLVNMIQTSMISKRIFVVGSNVNYLTGHTNGGWRGGLESSDLFHSKIFTGDIQLLSQASQASEEKIVLETRLDADDGLHKHYLEFVERDAKLKFSSGTYDFHFWCIESHIKLFIGNVDAMNMNGSMSHHSSNTTTYPQGMVEGERRSNFCMTPGLTIGMNVGYNVLQLPQYPHHELYRRLKSECLKDGEDGEDGSITIHSKNTTHNNNNNKNNTHHECITFITKIVSAIRSRTETSAGMEELQMHKPLGEFDKQQMTLWNILRTQFAIQKQNVISTNQYFIENRKMIASENLLGQCLGDHSCKNSTKIRLQRIIDGVV